MAPKVQRTVIDEFADFIRKKGPCCTVGVLIAASEPDYAAQLVGLFALPVKDAPHTAVVRFLRSKGDPVGATAIARHRRGDCGCQQ